MTDLKKEVVEHGFAKKGLAVINDKNDLQNWVEAQDFTDAVVLFMSSGNYDGFDALAFAQTFVSGAV